jgi:hypothetical protein
MRTAGVSNNLTGSGYDSRDLQRFGYIAKTLEASRVSSTLTIDPNNQRFRIYDIYPHNDILKGTMLDKIGHTTGWTYRYVTNACVDLPTEAFTGDGHPVALLVSVSREWRRR